MARRIRPVSFIGLGRMCLVYGWFVLPPKGEQQGDGYAMPHDMYGICPYAMVMHAMLCRVMCSCERLFQLPYSRKK